MNERPTNEYWQVAALVTLFLLTLWPVYVLENVFLWLAWGTAMVALSGAALVRMNR